MGEDRKKRADKGGRPREEEKHVRLIHKDSKMYLRGRGSQALLHPNADLKESSDRCKQQRKREGEVSGS